MFDKYGNHVKKDLEVQLNMEGFILQDQLGLKRKVRFFVLLCLVIKLINEHRL